MLDNWENENFMRLSQIGKLTEKQKNGASKKKASNGMILCHSKLLNGVPQVCKSITNM